MTERIQTTSVLFSIDCSIPECDEHVYPAALDDPWSLTGRATRAAAFELGWTLRVVRSRRWYCPEHREQGIAPTQTRYGGERAASYYDKDNPTQ